MSQALRKLAGNLSRANTVCLFTNQIREKIGVSFGSPETQPGGRALKFYSSQRLDIRRIETLKEGTEAVGNRVRVKVVKNKVAPPFRLAEFDIEYGVGHLARRAACSTSALEHDLVQKSGSFFSYGELRLGQGRNNSKEYLRENPEVANELEKKIHGKLAAEAPDAPEPKACVRFPTRLPIRPLSSPRPRRSRGGGAEEGRAEGRGKACREAGARQGRREEGCLSRAATSDGMAPGAAGAGAKERTEARDGRVAARARGGGGGARGGDLDG